jgi:hypothetical protein
MKGLALALLATAAALTAASARADTRVSVGIHVGGPTYRPAAPVVVHGMGPAHCPPPAAVHYVPARGYWTDVVVKTWVPERWFASRDRWGRPIRVQEPGYYTYRTERVWVEGHPNRAYGYAPQPGFRR